MSSKRLLTVSVLWTLVGCLDDSSQQTANVSQLFCSTIDDRSGVLGLLPIACVVRVGGTYASKEGIETSVSSILTARVLPEVCPGYTRSELISSQDEFSDDVREGLIAAYDQAGAGWEIGAVHCSLRE